MVYFLLVKTNHVKILEIEKLLLIERKEFSMKLFAIALLILLTMGALRCFGQMTPSMVTSSTRVLPTGETEIRATYKMEPGPMPVVTGDPFSLKQFFQKEQVLADGTAISKQTPAIKEFKDSAGRFRVEYQFKAPEQIRKNFDLPVQIEILDPVAKYHYIIDTVHRIVHRGVIDVRMAAQPRIPAPTPPKTTVIPGDAVRPERRMESLGEKVIEGQALEGKRTTAIYPAGSSMGNNAPVAVTSEVWSSPGSSMPPFRKTTDPRSGAEIAASYDIDHNEPDPSLFQLPAGYQVIDEPGPFAITFTYADRKFVR
jgi:hypothetical protein